MSDRERRARYMAADPEMYRGESADDAELIKANARIAELEASERLAPSADGSGAGS